MLLLLFCLLVYGALAWLLRFRSSARRAAAWGSGASERDEKGHPPVGCPGSPWRSAQHLSRGQVSGGDRHVNFHEDRDNLEGPDCWSPSSLLGRCCSRTHSRPSDQRRPALASLAQADARPYD